MNFHLHFLIQSHVPQAVSFYQSNFGGLDKVIRLSGYPHSVLTEILTELSRKARHEEIPVEIIHNCLDNTVQGVILPEQSAGVYGFDVYDPGERNIWTAAHPESFFTIIKNLEMARKTYQEAKRIHDEQEKVYIGHMDFQAADELTQETIHKLLAGRRSGHRGSGTDRFFGASTVKGSVNYVPDVIRDIPQRYYIKGRPGTGKSTFLKKIAREAVARGFHTEIYHCSFDANSLDMVTVRELDFCIFDSTAPHEFFPKLPGEEIIDIYARCVTPGTDEKYAEELAALDRTYKEKLAVASGYLKQVKKAYDQFEKTLPAFSGADVDDLTGQLIRELL